MILNSLIQRDVYPYGNNANHFGSVWGEYIANQTSTLTMDANQRVSAFAPYSGSAAVTFTAENDQRPTYTPNSLNTRATLALDGGDNYLDGGTNPPVGDNGMTVIMLGRHGAQASQMWVSQHVSSTNGMFFMGVPSDADEGDAITCIAINSDSTRTNMETGGIPANTWLILAFRVSYSLGKMTFFVNGSQANEDNFSGVLKTSGIGNLVLGNFSILSWPLSGNIAHVLFYDDALSNEAIQNLTQHYIRPYWNFWS